MKQEKNTPIVSVVVITYNQEYCLAQTLDAILGQHCDFDIEVIVGDDCSTDGTRAIIAHYAERYSNIKALYNEKNLGLVGNYISTIRHCTGRYIAMCDGDDVWIKEDKLQRQVDLLESTPTVGLVYTDVEMNATITNQKYIRHCPPPSTDVFSQLLIGNFITISSVCFRASLLRYIDFDEFIRNDYHMQDYPMWLEMCQHTEFRLIDEPMVSYLINHKVVTTDDVLNHACRFDGYTTKIREIYQRRYADKTSLTRADIWDEHYRMQIRAGLHYRERKRVLEYASKIQRPRVYEKRLIALCRSYVGFYAYLMYRQLTHKEKSSLEMYFGN